ncbi:ZIP family metal transporter [Candidatus Bathyarchaeota archaeon]|nr:ZIP family metal transporter [Candidatus Bathyarchaeota archaeon]
MPKPMEMLTPILLSLVAGSATGVGGLLVLVLGDIDERVIGFFMGFAGGVMLVVSFLQLYVEALTVIPAFQVTVAFGLGTVFMMAIDLTVPHIEFGEWEDKVKDKRLFNSGLVIAIGMTLHNLPEGVVVSAGFTHLPELGLLVALMICLHNIPEGIATVTPLIRSGVDRVKAVGLATLSGMAEPLGALIGATVINSLGGGALIVGGGLGFAAGVMTYVTIDELIPVAHEYCTLNHKHIVSSGLLVGMVFAQALSLVLPF